MATDFRTKRVTFDPTSGQVQNEPGTVTFNGNVRRAAVAIGGWSIEFTNGEHPVRKLLIDVHSGVQIQGSRVDFTVDFLLRDNSGNIDDPFKGFVDVVVIADVA